jgi:hypothetical protein
VQKVADFEQPIIGPVNAFTSSIVTAILLMLQSFKLADHVPKAKISRSQNQKSVICSHFWKMSFLSMLLPLILILCHAYSLSSQHVTDNDLKTGIIPGCFS